jgi:hypothetical protein
MADFKNNKLFTNAFKRRFEQTKACVVSKNGIKDLVVFIRQYITNGTTSASCDILSPVEKQIKNKTKAVGTSLKGGGILVYYGIKKGFSDAFILSGKKRKGRMAQDPKSAENIRPVLCGKDMRDGVYIEYFFNNYKFYLMYEKN